MEPQASKSEFTNIITNSLLIFLGITLALFIIEGVLRWVQVLPFAETAVELSWTRDNPGYNIFTVDPEFGFRPILGNGLYNEYGTKANHYPFEKRAGVTRLLFIGDSATHRSQIIDALKELYGEERFEYWNAGVESFSTVQEVNYYKKYNARINPDHVILTFHLNDFETTPIAFEHEGDGLIVYIPHKPLRELNPWLFKHSYSYRLLIGLIADTSRDRAAVIDETEVSLKELRDILANDAIRFTVLLLPLFKPYDQWQAIEKKARVEILQIMEVLEIDYFDLYEINERAIAAGVMVREDPGGGYWHPSQEVSILFAGHLYKNNLLSD